jgi:para-aminobenzoate synthetase/4-amino-4-deoxychorismate lyase
MKTTCAGHIVLQVNREWITLRRPEAILSTAKPTEVMDVLDRVQAHLDTGKIAAGYLAYEAAPAFDSHFEVHPTGDTPLAWFGIYPEAEKGMLTPEDTGEDFSFGEWKSAMDLEAFTTAVARIHTYIASGDSYQVNLTFPMEASFRVNRGDYSKRWQLHSQVRIWPISTPATRYSAHLPRSASLPSEARPSPVDR